jgi:hypothetical protein
MTSYPRKTSRKVVTADGVARQIYERSNGSEFYYKDGVAHTVRSNQKIIRVTEEVVKKRR